jgi:hypothetical protein
LDVDVELETFVDSRGVFRDRSEVAGEEERRLSNFLSGLSFSALFDFKFVLVVVFRVVLPVFAFVVTGRTGLGGGGGTVRLD